MLISRSRADEETATTWRTRHVGLFIFFMADFGRNSNNFHNDTHTHTHTHTLRPVLHLALGSASWLSLRLAVTLCSSLFSLLSANKKREARWEFPRYVKFSQRETLQAEITWTLHQRLPLGRILEHKHRNSRPWSEMSHRRNSDVRTAAAAADSRRSAWHSAEGFTQLTHLELFTCSGFVTLLLAGLCWDHLQLQIFRKWEDIWTV